MISCVKSRFNDAVAQECSEMGCTLNLYNFGEAVVLKGERVCSTRKMCDCIIFAEKEGKTVVCAVELKSRAADAEEVAEKLANGAEASLEVLRECGGAANPSLYLIVLAKSWRRPEYSVITRKSIAVRGRKLKVIPARCGASLSEIVSGS